MYLCACVSETEKEKTWKVIIVDTTKSHLATVSLKRYIVCYELLFLILSLAMEFNKINLTLSLNYSIKPKN